MMRTIRPAQATDLESILAVLAAARIFMCETGNPHQWGPTCWPPEALIRKDIADGCSYVCLNDGGKVVGTFFFVSGEDIEPTYRTITGGAWLDDTMPYYVVHRIASYPHAHGIFDAILDWCFAQHPNIRIDTHRDNRIMQHLITRYGFGYCGIIHVASGAERLAYQKIRNN